MSKLGKELWVEKYRPATIKDTLMPAEFKKFFTNIVESGEVPNLLLESASPGSGKCLYRDEEINIKISAEFWEQNKHKLG